MSLNEALKTFSTEQRARIAEEARHWQEIPPSITDFILEPEYLDQGDFVCDAVLQTLENLFNPKHEYREGVLVWGIGAGKSYACSIALAYTAYCILCLRDPQDYYGLAPGSEIAVVNFSVTATQAKKVVFGEVLARLKNAPCFQRPGFRRDERINSELRWPEKNVIIFPGNSEAESAIGYNVLASVVDEAAWLPTTTSTERVAGRATGGVYDAAEELYNAISKRIASRGNNRWQRDARFVMISSPRYEGDFTEAKVREAESDSNIYATRMPTWEGAPKSRLSGETFEDPVLGPVPVEYEKDFKRDPERARRDLGAQPSDAIDRYFTKLEKLEAAYDDSLPDLMDGIHFGSNKQFSGHMRVAHIDLALKHDRAGLAVCHSTGEEIVFDIVTYFELDDFQGEAEIDLQHIRNVLLTMKRWGCKFGLVTYDGFQSADSRQLLRKQGIPTDHHSVDRNTESYDALKEVLYADMVRLPDTERSRMFQQEARSLELVKGKKVDHPPRGSKDVADAVAGAVYDATLAGVKTTRKVRLV